MTPHRSHNRGSYVLDRVFQQIGRIRVASGTHDLATFRRLNDMITTLRETGRWDLLRALRDGIVKPLEVWSAFRLGQVDQLPVAEELVLAQSAITAWLPRLEATERHRESYRQALDRMLAGHPQLRLPDLPGRLKAYRDTCQDTGRRRTFNLTRSALQALVRDRLGSSHRLWRAVADVPRLRETPRKGNPQTVEQAGKLAEALGLHRGVLWSLCLTGMRRGEYWAADAVHQGLWEVKGDRILVHGTKTKAADRFIPLVLPPAVPSIGYWGFAQLLRSVTNGKVNVHDLRKTYATWMEAAGVLRARRRLYLGHGQRDVTDLYEAHEVLEFIAGDAEKLRLFIGDEPAKALKVG